MVIMKKMMNLMIKSMSAEEKEKLMLFMINSMKKEVDVAESFPEIAKTVGNHVTISGTLTLLKKIENDPELYSTFKDNKNQLPSLMERAGDKFAVMSSAMPVLMEQIIAKMIDTKSTHLAPIMMPFMKTIMPMMMSGMSKKLQKDKTLRDTMTPCMAKMMPHCISSFYPLFSSDDQEECRKQIETTFTDKPAR